MEPPIVKVLLIFLLIVEVSDAEVSVTTVSPFHYYNPVLTNCHNNIMHSCAHGECIYVGHKSLDNKLHSIYKCICPDGWLGERCDIEDVCPEHGHWLCLNGGTCSRNQCHCPDGFYGRRCQHRFVYMPGPDNCDNHECQPYSTCVSESTGYRCECQSNRIGVHCEHIHPCYGSNNECQNDATCVADNKTGEYQCICKPGFEGGRCEVDLDMCATNSPCVMGTCVNEPRGSFTCHCQPGYYGTCCELIHPCYGANNKCRNDATCVLDNKTGEYQCMCKAGFEGNHCEVNLDRCTTDSPCLMGTCVNEPRGSFTCHCQPGYIGKSCDQELRPCEPWPCQNGGYCFNRLLTYECRCPAGFGGRNCEIDQRTSSAVEQDNCRWSADGVTPCQNGARCVNHDGGFECICPRGFVGGLCEISIAAPTDSGVTGESSAETMLSATTLLPTAMTEAELSLSEVESTTSNFTDAHLDSVTVVTTSETASLASMGGTSTAPTVIEEISKSVTTATDRSAAVTSSKAVTTSLPDFITNAFSSSPSVPPSTDVTGLAPTVVATVLPNRYMACGSHAERCFLAFADGRCDQICNTEACLFDGFDCAPSTSPQCAHLHYCRRHYADGRCDAECDAVECGWDGGDCDDALNGTSGSGTGSVIVDGELVLVIAASEQQFFFYLTEFMVALSGRLRASLRVAVDARGRAEIYQVQRSGVKAESGAEESTTRLIDLPDGWDAEALRVIYHPSGFVGLSELFPSREDVLALSLSAENSEIKVVFRLDVTACQTRQQQQHDFECFSQMESVAEFVGVASEKNLIHANLSVLAASVQMSNDKRDHANGVPPALVGALVAFALVAMLLVVFSRSVLYPKKRKVYAAAQWNPPTLGKSRGDSRANTNSLTSFEASFMPSDTVRHSLYTANMANFGSPYYWASSATSLCPSGFSSSNTATVSLTASSMNPIDGAASVDRLSYRQFNGSQVIGELKNGSSNGPPNNFVGAIATAETSRHCETERLALHVLAETPGGINCETPIDRRLVNEPGLYLRRTPLLTLFTPLPFRRTDADLITAAERLIRCGADINAQDKHQNTALILAVKHCRVEVVRRLLQLGADPNMSDICEQYPLYHAVLVRSPAIVALLLADQRIDVDATNGRRETALMCCARLGGDSSLECARLLIDCGKADVNAIGDPVYPECERRSALNYAASYNNVPMIHLLVNRGADQNAMDDRKLTPLTAAAYNGHMEAVDALLMLGAKQHFEDELSAPYEHRIIRERYPHIADRLKEAKTRYLKQLQVNSTADRKTTKNGDCGATTSKKQKTVDDVLTTDCPKLVSLSHTSSTLLTPPLSDESTHSPQGTSSSLSPQQATAAATAEPGALLTSDADFRPTMAPCNNGSTGTGVVLNTGGGLTTNNADDVGTVDARFVDNNFGNSRQGPYDSAYYERQQQQYAQEQCQQQQSPYNNCNNFFVVAAPQMHESEQHFFGYADGGQQQLERLHQYYSGTPYPVQQPSSFIDAEQHQLSNQYHVAQLHYEQHQYAENMVNATPIQQLQQPMLNYHQYPNHHPSSASLPAQWY